MAVVGGALATVMLVGVIVARAGSGDTGPDGNTSASVAGPSASSPSATGPSTPAAPNASIDEAQDAAIKVVGRTGEVVAAGFISRRELIEMFTTRSFGPTFADETGRAIDAMLIELGSREVDLADVVVREQPITSTASATSDGVQVRVWSVLIIAAPGTGPGRQVWRTVKLDMVQHDGVWLVDGWASSPGPTPSPPAEGVVDSAESVAVPLSWDPVGAS
ncbi:MAG: hypothetical protein Q8M22_20485 [Actinomycetota bacterium]|nr:hypothetical protein [Actinomycetota bacterium]